ncbi:MAG: hypothetical protein DWQ36_21570 [Acidobacteria bacterium]|nr:MAG: hypothetical protein DWQ30_09480 [Acidobacteriota bacterium]REK01098.1 MAG: hypothetical protein DWQ36_21570 [Acidobacteriota bacterium]
MEPRESLHELEMWMLRFRRARALVVDVLGNRGGARQALLRLFSEITPRGGPPRVVNVAAVRRHPAHGPHHLQARFMAPADSETWSPRERRAIRDVATTFDPEVELPPGQFGEWNYLVLSPLREFPTAAPATERPVYVLMDEKCFSATDIFLAGLKGLPGVILVGAASSGGSAFAQRIVLSEWPRLEVRLASMASFRADGRLFDGHGVQPDVVVEPAPEDFVSRSDRVLEEALRLAQGDLGRISQ